MEKRSCGMTREAGLRETVPWWLISKQIKCTAAAEFVTPHQEINTKKCESVIQGLGAGKLLLLMLCVIYPESIYLSDDHIDMSDHSHIIAEVKKIKSKR